MIINVYLYSRSIMNQDSIMVDVPQAESKKIHPLPQTAYSLRMRWIKAEG